MDQQKRELVLLDYDKTQNFIDKIDEFLFRIRNWALIAASGVIAYAVSNKNAPILIANIFIIVGFMAIELCWKSFHEDALAKGSDLEKLIDQYLLKGKPLPTTYRFGIGEAIHTVSLKRMVRILLNLGRWHNLAFYLLLALASVGAWLVIAAT